MLPKEKLDRINYLANKEKNSSLTESEKQEQQELRKEYIQTFKKQFRGMLDNIEIVDTKH